jgi:hypothetical protein
MRIRVTEWLTVTQLAVDMEVDKKAVFPPVQYDYLKQLHPSFFMWWEGNFTQRFRTPPSEEHARSGWTRMAAAETCKETIHCFCEHLQTGCQLQ